MNSKANIIEQDIDTDVSEAYVSATINTEGEETSYVPLPLGNALSIEEIKDIVCWEKALFIALVGPAGCGKTTLTAAIYQFFLKQNVDEYFFAGSKTLLGFEHRSFLTRIRSDGSKPDTIKTQRGADEILHLRLLLKKQSKYLNLLFTDFSGEDFASVIGNIQYAKADFEIVRSAHVLIALLDGEALCIPEQRNGCVTKAIELIKTFSDSNLITDQTKIILAVSKCDLVKKKATENPLILDYLNTIPNKLKVTLQGCKLNIDYMNLAAFSDNKEIFDADKSLSTLLDKFATLSSDPISTANRSASNELHSQFNRFFGISRGGL